MRQPVGVWVGQENLRIIISAQLNFKGNPPFEECAPWLLLASVVWAAAVVVENWGIGPKQRKRTELGVRLCSPQTVSLCFCWSRTAGGNAVFGQRLWPLGRASAIRALVCALTTLRRGASVCMGQWQARSAACLARSSLTGLSWRDTWTSRRGNGPFLVALEKFWASSGAAKRRAAFSGRPSREERPQRGGAAQHSGLVGAPIGQTERGPQSSRLGGVQKRRRRRPKWSREKVREKAAKREQLDYLPRQMSPSQ